MDVAVELSVSVATKIAVGVEVIYNVVTGIGSMALNNVRPLTPVAGKLIPKS